MPIHVEQLESSADLLYRFSGDLALADLDHLHAAEAPFYADLPGEECLGVIADVSGLDTIAAQLFPALQQMRIVQHPRVCVLIVVGANPYLRALAISLGMLAAQHDVVFRRTIDEARAVLAAYRAGKRT